MATLNNKMIYEASYIRFETHDKKEGAALSGPDNAIGDIGSISIKHVSNESSSTSIQAILINRFGNAVGFLSAADSIKLAAFEAKGWKLSYVLSLVAFSERPEPGMFWGEAAVFSYDVSQKDAFERFIENTAMDISTGKRPNINLSDIACVELVESQGNWHAGGSVALPKIDKQTAILKSSRSLHDKILDGARSKNPGCLLGGWVVLLEFVSLCIYLLHAAGIF